MFCKVWLIIDGSRLPLDELQIFDVFFKPLYWGLNFVACARIAFEESIIERQKAFHSLHKMIQSLVTRHLIIMKMDGSPAIISLIMQFDHREQLFIISLIFDEIACECTMVDAIALRNSAHFFVFEGVMNQRNES